MASTDRRRRAIRAAGAALLIAVPAALPALRGNGQPAGADPDRSAALYAAECASCHGTNLEGQPDWQSPGPDGVLRAPPHDETGHTWHHGDALLFDYVRDGGAAALAARGVEGFASSMPGFGDRLDDAQIADILAYIKSTWPDRIREIQAARSAAED